MTRYMGKQLQAESVKNIKEVSEKKHPEENTARYKIWKCVKSYKNGLTINEIEEKTGRSYSRRRYESILAELTNTKQITRYKCRCGCSYIYYP